ncbi:MAG: hypothetical protein JSV91_07250 [Phycisphaerales bacterium]|nr:MAG: hypothetical protein JSV91_07250 [Phycisphaerales bacterium]
MLIGPALTAAVLIAAAGADIDPDLLTIAEASDFKATATHAEVMELLQRIDAVDDERTNLMHLTEFGRSFEGRTLPLAIIADPPVRTPEEAKATGKPIVYAWGDIHAGEVCGKEALLMLARELVTTPDHPLLDDLIILLAPIYNADGNDRMDRNNRPGQVGPEEGMGQRRNAQNLDLNRDWVKLESPEAQAMVGVFNDWDPHITIDLHTTNGSHHRNALTFDGLLNPSCHEPALRFVHHELLPAVSERLEERTGYKSFYYGNFNRAQTIWATYSCDPRFSGPYCGLRGHLAILSEAYAYISYKDRVMVTLEFVREIMTYAIENRDRVIELHEQARAETIVAGENPQPGDVVGIQHRLVAFNSPATVPGYVMEPGEGRRRRPRPTEVEKDYQVIHLGRFEPTLSVRRPYAYLLKPGLDGVVEKLRQHGIEVMPFEGDARVEAYTVMQIDRAQRTYQGHNCVTLQVEASDQNVSLPAGAMIVRTAQPLGTLAVYLLEPQSSDSLTTWNLLDDHLEVGGEFPVYRVQSPADLN